MLSGKRYWPIGVALAFSFVVRADVLEEFGDGSLGTELDWNTLTNTLTILEGNGNEYKLWVHDGTGVPGTGVINSITIDSGATGDFTLLIDHPTTTPDLAGALHWRTGDLRYAGGTCTIVGIDLAGNLCADSSAVANIFAENISGNIRIGGSLSLAGVPNSTSRKLEAQAVVGNITLGGLVGDLDLGSFDGALLVGEDVGGRTGGDVFIHSSFGGGMSFTDSQGFAGSIRIEGDFTGAISVSNSMFGDIDIQGNLTAPASLTFLEFVSRSSGGEPPNVRVRGSVTGTSITPLIVVGNEAGGGGLNGTIAINGTLNNVNLTGPEILIIGPINENVRGAIAVDYDGWDSGDDWAAGAHVLESVPGGAQTYYGGNSPADGVYEINQCIGDMDNDGILTAIDATLHNDARRYLLPVGGGCRDAYVDQVAGLEGSIYWHGDLNGDAAVDCVDLGWIQHLTAGGPWDCCLSTHAAVLACRADFD